MDDRDHMIDVVAHLPWPEFRGVIRRMMSATYVPGTALDPAPPTSITASERTRIAGAIDHRRRRHLQLAVDRGLSERDIPPRPKRASVVRHCD